MVQPHVPTSIGPAPYPYLEFVPPLDYSTHSLDLLTRNMLDVYRTVERDLQRQWAQVVNDPSGGRARARLTELFASIDRSKSDVGNAAEEWLQHAFPGRYAQGMANMRERYSSAPSSWTQPHRDAVGLLAVDTFDSLLRPTQFEPDAIKATVRELARAQVAQSIVGGDTATQAGRDLRDKLAAQGIFGVTYADGKFMPGSSYADMVVRTRTAIAYNAGGINQARADGIDVFEISDGPDCGLSFHDDDQLANGMIVDPDTAASFPISHPNCVRDFLPRPDLTPTDVAAGNFDTITDPERASDQAAFDLFLRQDAVESGRTLVQSAAEFGRQERAGRVPRVERAGRTPRASAVEPVAAPVPRVPEPEPVHPSLEPLTATAAHPLADNPTMTALQVLEQQSGSEWWRPNGQAGPVALEREQSYQQVGENVLSTVEQRLAAEGLARPATHDEIRAANKTASNAVRSMMRREDKVSAKFEEAHPEWARKSPTYPVERLRAGEEFDPSLQARRSQWRDERRDALRQFDKRYDTLARKRERADAESIRLLDSRLKDGPIFQARAREITLEELTKIRPFGDVDLNISRSSLDRDAITAVNAAREFYPSEWLRASNDLGMIAVDSDQRGYYRHNDSGTGKIVLSRGQRSLVQTDVEMLSVALHEMAHRMERTVGEIRPMEHALYSRRTDAEWAKATPLKKLFPGGGYRPDETARPDEFVNPYMGKTYGDSPTSSWELFSMGVEGLWTGSNDVWADRDMLKFIFGILAGA